MSQLPSINQILIDNANNHPDRVYLRQPNKGIWREYTWKEVITQARQLAQFLQNQGLQKGAHVAIYSKNCAEWFITDFGIALAGMVSVPLFPNQHKDTLIYILEHADVEFVVIGKLDDHKRARRAIPETYKTVCFQYHSDLPVDFHWDDVLSTPPLDKVVEPLPTDLYTLIYTSGTSKMPKGVMVTHEIVSRYLKTFPEDYARVNQLPFNYMVSYLPLAHVYERTTVEFGSIVIPSSVSFIERLDTFVKNMKEIQPTMFAAVPRIWGVFKQKIEQSISPQKLKILLHIPIVAAIIKSKIRAQIGLSRCAHTFSGAAHLPLDTIDFFNRIGVKIQEGYGQTENLAYGTFQKVKDRRKGYAGSPRAGVEIKIGPEQELLFKSPCMMAGYYKDPEATSQAFTKDGWLHTGDIAEIKYGQVKILGRLAENFKNQKGEFIAPTPIEKRFGLNKLIEMCCLVGREQPSNLMIIKLTPEAERLDKDWVKEALQDTLKTVNLKLKSYEKVSRIIVVQDAWTPENNILTPTLKIKRHIVETKYHDLITKAVANREIISWQSALLEPLSA